MKNWLSFCLNSLFVVGLMALLRMPSTAASGGRDFAGFYELSNVVEDVDFVSFTFTTRVFNYSGQDVADAIVLLEDLLFFDEHGSFLGVWIVNGESVLLEGNFTVPTEEYDLWLQGVSPSLSIETQDIAGDLVRRRIELANLLLGEEN